MKAFVSRGDVKVGDEVWLELHKMNVTDSRAEKQLVAIIQCTTVKSVEPSEQHPREGPDAMDDIEF